MCFRKTLVVSDFNEKVAQNVAQATMSYYVSKDFLRLHFAVDDALSISEYYLENGRMHKYCIKAMAVKISILILFRFCLL